jgi:predicted unusual protein kinase regulating ubiquinone biosynthesis (AarF/ABC1/UbiB family)
MASRLRLLPRRLHMFTTAFLVYSALSLTRWATRVLPLSARASEFLWARTHAYAADRMLHLAMTRRGLLVKACQYLASRTDILPLVYTETLSRCLDNCPPDPPHLIAELVAAELHPRRVEEVFIGFDPANPIASASIAQVHTATLRSDGRRVAVKVQHPEIRENLITDLSDLSAVLNFVGGSDPYACFRLLLPCVSYRHLDRISF